MSTLFIRHPARAEGDSAPVRYALVADNGSLVQEGEGALGGLSELVGASRQVVLVLAAPDVNLLSVRVPPMSASRLRAALPNLVEELILGDPGESVIVAAALDSADGMRAVAVADRAWLETVVKVLLAEGARRVQALPAQLCLPLAPGGATAAIDSSGVALRQGPYQGLGMALDAPPAVALQTVRALAGPAPLTLLVPHTQLGEYQALVAEAEPGVMLESEQWSHWIAGARACTLDLMAGLGASTTKPRDWQRWKWPLRLALAVFLVNVAGLNIEWLRMKREAQALRMSMNQTFRQVYPNVALQDPVAQMRQMIGLARANRGQLNPDEFTYQAAAFGEAMRRLPRAPVVASLAFANRSLTVKAKPESVDAGAAAQLQTYLAERKLALTETAPGEWRVSNKEGR